MKCIHIQYLTLITGLRNQEAGLRHDSEHKRRETERLREQAGQECVSGIDHRMHGNLAQANPILRRVEQLIHEADRLEEESKAHIRQIESNNEGIPCLVASVEMMTNFRDEILQGMVGLQNRLTRLQSKIQEKTEESKDNRRRFYEIRDKEDKYVFAAIIKEEEAAEKGRLSEEAEREAQRIEQVI